jgi:hypothetical protein
MAGIEPVAVWDARDRAWRRRGEARSQWLRGEGLPVDQMFRAEFLLIDAPCARIFCYALNEDGRRYIEGHSRDPHDHDACEAATEPPRIVPLSTLPPRELLDG